MRALRHPALGLVLVVLATRALPSRLSLLSQMLLLGFGGWPGTMLVLVLGQIVVTGLQFATGSTRARLARDHRRRRILRTDLRPSAHDDGLIAPIGPLAASTVVAAWLHRKAA